MALELNRLLRRLPLFGDFMLLKEQNRFLLGEVRKLNEAVRALLSQNPNLRLNDEQQTTESFDFQWNQIPEGRFLPNDREFMRQAVDHVVRITGRPADWFPGKKVVDVGCGTGRFSYALLSLGAHVTSVDQSEWACRRTAELCQEFADRSVVRHLNLLSWTEPASFDLAFSFGVVHHTGRTYLAIRNVAEKITPGGHLFLMVYGYPTEFEHFTELNSYEDLRQELRALPPTEKHVKLTQRFGSDLAHGYFDAVSPKINDLLTYEELDEFLRALGFAEVRCTLRNRNHHIIARKNPTG